MVVWVWEWPVQPVIHFLVRFAAGQMTVWRLSGIIKVEENVKKMLLVGIFFQQDYMKVQ